MKPPQVADGLEACYTGMACDGFVVPPDPFATALEMAADWGGYGLIVPTLRRFVRVRRASLRRRR